MSAPAREEARLLSQPGLRGLLTDVRGALGGAHTVDIVSGYLSLAGLSALRDQLAAVVAGGGRVRLLIGVAPPELEPLAVQLGDLAGLPGAGALPVPPVGPLLAAADAALAGERDAQRFDSGATRALLALAALLQHPDVEVRRYERAALLHAKAVLVDAAPDTDGGQAVLGSSNLTLGGLLRNGELNAAVRGPAVAAAAARFAAWWDDAVPYDLLGLVLARFAAHPGALVYLRMLQAHFGQSAATVGEPLPLKEFQADGIAKAEAVLTTHGGVLIADEVGLGKTWLAGELVRRRVLARKPVLIVAPARIRDSVWKPFCEQHLLAAHIVGYEHFTAGRTPRPLREYAMVVFDEAHQLRNPGAKRAAAAAAMARLSPRPEVVLLTATPVNNAADDLWQMLRLTDRSLTGQGWVDQAERWLAGGEATRGHLFDWLDERMLRRTRSFIDRQYGPQGFPALRCSAVRYALPQRVRDLLTELDRAVRDEDGGALQLAAYTPHSFLLDVPAPAWEPRLRVLLLALLLKRAESSPAALRGTLRRMLDRTDEVLADLAAGAVAVGNTAARATARRRLIELVGDTDDPDLELAAALLEESGADLGAYPASAFDVSTWTTVLHRDRAYLQQLLEQLADAGADRKLGALLDRLTALPGTGQGGRVLLFTGAAATLDYLLDALRTAADSDPRLAAYAGRIAAVGGGHNRTPGQLGAVLDRFHRPAGDPDAVLLLLATDVLAEGQNLQVAGHVVHYDLPWNPQVLGQRNGRIDRLGSMHSEAVAHALLPDAALDELLGLMNRLHAKADVAAATVGVPTPLFPDCVVEPRDFTGLLADWRAGRDVDLAALRAPAVAFTDDLLRRWLSRALADEKIAAALAELPAAAGALVPAAGADRAVTFCVRLPDEGGERYVFRSVVFRPAGMYPAAAPRECLRIAQVDVGGWLDGGAELVAVEELPAQTVGGWAQVFTEQVLPGVSAEYGVAPEQVQVVCWLARE